MLKETICGSNGYHIPCLNNYQDGEKMAVIVSHGFGSSKESPTAQAISAALSEQGIGTYSFDFPAHGDSLVTGDLLRIDNCVNDLAAVEAHIHKLRPDTEIAYFSSSFGAYINLIYLSTHPHLGRKSFLRCAAVDMPELFRNGTSAEQYTQLSEQGYFILDLNYFRPLKITKEFFDDLEAHDLFRLCRPEMAELAMIHGDADETASVVEARRFAEQFGAKLTEVQGGDHRLMNPGAKEQVIDCAVQFFKIK